MESTWVTSAMVSSASRTVDLLTHSHSRRCEMWYQRVFEPGTIKLKPANTIEPEALQEYTQLPGDFGELDVPAQFRRVRLRFLGHFISSGGDNIIS